MRMSYVRLTVGIGLLAVVLLASCDLFGSDDGVSRSERRDIFISQIQAGQFNRLNENMHPNVRIAEMNEATYWENALDDAGSGWSFTVLSTSQVRVDSSPSSAAVGVLTFTYGSRGDDYYFTRIDLNAAQIVPVP